MAALPARVASAEVEVLSPRIQSECSLSNASGLLALPVPADGERPCRFRIVANVSQPRPLVHATIVTIEPRFGKTRDHVSLTALEETGTGEVATPWVELIGTYFRKTATEPSLQGVVGDDVTVYVSLGGKPPSTLHAQVGPPRKFSPLLLCPLSTKVVAHRKLGAAQRWAMTQAIAAHVDWTNEVLGQCGISVGLEPPGSFEFNRPPSATLLSLGDDLGMLPYSSDVTVVDEGRALRPFRGNGLLEPVIAASRLSDFLATQGLQCQVIANPRRSSQAFASADMACRHSDGSLARLRVEAKTGAGAISVASVDLRDGLSCYLPDAASTGSTEQRALVHLDRPTPPNVVRLVIVDKLSCSHLLGQSFADHPDSPLWGTIILDRRGLARGRQTFTLAHELGHVLLGTSSHPEDHGIADKDLLMNSLSSSIYLGPHRILEAQCEIMRRSPLLVSPQR